MTTMELKTLLSKPLNEASSSVNQQDLSTLTQGESSPPQSSLTLNMVEASINLDRRTADLKQKLEAVETAGVMVGPLRTAMWNFCKAYATMEILKILKANENKAMEIIAEKKNNN